MRYWNGEVFSNTYVFCIQYKWEDLTSTIISFCLLAVNYYAMQMAVHLKMTSVDDALENE